MAYEKKTWVCGETITADGLNNIEQGIQEALDCCGSGGDPGYSCTETSTTLTEESVTTARPDPSASFAMGNFSYSTPISADSLTVTFNGTEYEADKKDLGGGTYAYGGVTPSGPDFTNYPFVVFSSSATNTLYTENEGTYSVKLVATTSTVTASECFGKAVKSFGLKYVKDANIVGGVLANDVGNNAVTAQYALAEGKNSTASGEASHAEGSGTASGEASHAEGSGTASGEKSHAEGSGTASGEKSHAESGGAARGNFSHAEGLNTDASGNSSHAEGNSTNASADYSHAEGDNTKANGNSSHAEGYGTNAKGFYCHAEGQNTTADGKCSHAEGEKTQAIAYSSHSEGRNTVASGNHSHAEGDDTIANHYAQHAFGACNVADPSTAAATDRGTYIEIVGNGTNASNRSNARTLDWQGNETLAGSITLGNTTLTEAQLIQLLALLN